MFTKLLLQKSRSDLNQNNDLAANTDVTPPSPLWALFFQYKSMFYV